ncbi:MAG TPA: hypothetical protein PLP19_00735 [bacterium]|nr:hypothetical protein [bacterium]HPN41990.1 hypothetical protein [bacterium]
MKNGAVKTGRKNKGFFANFLVFSITCLFCLLLAEAGIRLFAPQKLITQYRKIWRPDEVYGWRHQENLSTLINSGEGTVHFVTDSNGYRINSESEEQAFLHTPPADNGGDEHYSILFIGDSYLEAIQVENHCIIPQVIRKNLLQNYGANVNVTNASCGKWNPNHYLLEAQRFAPQQYDLAVIFLYLGNDVVCDRVSQFSPRQIHVHLFRWPQRLSFAEIKAAILYPLNEELEGHSHLYVLLKKRTKWLRMKWGLSPYYIPEVFKTAMQPSTCWQTTTGICAAIKDEFDCYNTPCFFVFLPTDFQTDVKIFNAYIKSLSVDTTTVDLDQPQNKLGRLFADSALTFADPLDYMRDRVNQGEHLYGFIDSHLNEEGHKVVAEFIEPTIRTILLEDKAAAGSVYK